MTPKHKAIELINKFRIFNGTFLDGDGEPKNSYRISKADAKQCASICVQEIILNNEKLIETGLNNDFDIMNDIGYWKSVLQELQSL